MFEYFKKLFSTEGFPPRWECGDWSTGHGILHIASDLAIFGAYFAIPVLLLFFLQKRGEQLPFPRILFLFAAFILCCGTTHLIDATLFFEPRYRLSGLMKLITAVVSWWTVITLIGIISAVLRLPGLAELNRSLQERIEAQNEAEKRLEQRNEELSHFAAVVAHDVKTPLSSAIMFNALAREAHERGDTATATRVLGELEKTLQTAARLIDDIHSFSSGIGSRLDLEYVALDDLFVNLRQSLRQPIEEKEATLEVGELPAVRGNESALLQIFGNLIQNAIKYRHPDRPSVIRVEARSAVPKDASRVRIAVTDNGIGIADHHQDKIFEPFWRAKEQSDVEGSGLGLSVSHKLAERLGAELSVESVHGEGTTFFLELPLA